MIQIDDAGNGAVLGGEVIGALRVETGQYCCKVLPLQVYHNFEILRTRAAGIAVNALLKELKHDFGEAVVFCTGDVFKYAKDDLTERGIAWTEEKIVGLLQDEVENSYFDSLLRYGLPEQFRAIHNDYHKFHNRVLSWVCQDLSRRAKHCKPLRLNSGLISRTKAFRTIVPKTRTCPICSFDIPAASVAVFDKSGESPQLIHLNCYFDEVLLADFQEELFDKEIARSFLNKFVAATYCSACGLLLKRKKRIVQYKQGIYHFTCFTSHSGLVPGNKDILEES